MEFDDDYGYYCLDCDGSPGIDFDYNEEFVDLLLELAPTPFLLHCTAKQNWTKIQQEGLVPKSQKNSRLKWYRKKFGIDLPDHVIWFGREPAEVFANKDHRPIVIALPMNQEKFGLEETLSEVEYVANKHIFPESFLGVFDFMQHPKGDQEEKSFLKWLEEMEENNSV